MIQMLLMQEEEDHSQIENQEVVIRAEATIMVLTMAVLIIHIATHMMANMEDKIMDDSWTISWTIF